MTNERLQEEYFHWIYLLVANPNYANYSTLLRYLHTIDFTYTIPMDSNREGDGINLRYRFGDETNHSERIISRYLDHHPCSILEMMAALALRCDETIAYDFSVGSRTGLWFWSMIENLGLGDMTDDSFNQNIVDTCIEDFLNRDYAPNGAGGLFTVNHPMHDMRAVEIWYQMNWYMDEYLKGEH